MAEPAVLDCDQSYYKRRGTAGEPEYRRHLGRAGAHSTECAGQHCLHQVQHNAWSHGCWWLFSYVFQAVAKISDVTAVGAITAHHWVLPQAGFTASGLCQRRSACSTACSGSWTAIDTKALLQHRLIQSQPFVHFQSLSGLAGPPASTLKPEGKRMVPVPRGEGTQLRGTRQFPERKVQTSGELSFLSRRCQTPGECCFLCFSRRLLPEQLSPTDMQSSRRHKS